MKKDNVAVANHSMFKDGQDPFQILGLDPIFDIDTQTLETAYFSRQALAHPDRFVYHSGPERQAASRQSSLLNHAYETLKNPVLRAKTILKLRGVEIPGESAQGGGKTVHNSKVLGEMMELQEALEEAVSPHDLAGVEKHIQDRQEGVMRSFSAALQEHQASQLTELYLRLSYLSKMLDDLNVRRRQLSVKVL